MLKLLIVDDEPMFREGLIKTIDWASMDIRIAGEAFNGLEALSIIEKCELDFVLTDIRMPEMDGLELIRAARRIKPRLGFIVLSAYDDFSLVKEAFKLGVVDYILKSEVGEEEILQIIERQQSALSSSGGSDRNSDYCRNNEFFLKQQLLRSCVERRIELESVPDFAVLFGKPDSRPLCSVFLRLHAFSDVMIPGDSESLIEEVHRKLDDFLYVSEEWVGYWENKRSMVLFDLSPRSADWNCFSLRCEELKKAAANFFPVEKGCVTLGLCSFRLDRNFSRVRREAEKACEYSFFRGIGRCISYNHYQSSLDKAQVDIQSLFRHFAGIIDRQEFDSESYEKCLLNPYSCNGDQKEAITGLYQKYYHYLLAFLEARGTGPDNEQKNLIDLFPHLRSEGASLDDLNKWFRRIMNMLGILENKALSLSSKVSRYLDKHYREDVSLSDAAESLEVNPSYLSRVFSSEMKIGFTQYLLELRIKKALKLMESTNLKHYQIAEEVGFSNPESYSRGFKKVMGVSPSRFRH
ncbi:MAG: response regulator [Spirochaetales bacterium]|nr:response regulator [Spirochaetales bacterium]